MRSTRKRSLPPVESRWRCGHSLHLRPARVRARAALSARVRLRHGALRGGETDLRMRPVAERLRRRPTAAAEGNRLALVGEVELIAVRVDQGDRAADAVGAVLAGLDLDFSHRIFVT